MLLAARKTLPRTPLMPQIKQPQKRLGARRRQRESASTLAENLGKEIEKGAKDVGKDVEKGAKKTADAIK